MKKLYLFPMAIFSTISLVAMARKPAISYVDCSTVTDPQTKTCNSNPSCASGKNCHTTNGGCSCIVGPAEIIPDSVQADTKWK